MKRFVMPLMAALLCMMALAACALGEESSPFYHVTAWALEDVDVSGVEVVDGRLVGEVKLPETTIYGRPTAPLYVDCPMPKDFTAEQRVTLHVARRPIDARRLKQAMTAIGQMTRAGKMHAYAGGAETMIEYACADDPDSGYFHSQLCAAEVSANPAFAKAHDRAKETVRSLAAQLGGEIAESVFHANQNGALTMVRGLYALRDLPVMDQFYYRADGEWIGASSEIRAAVREDGTLCAVHVYGLPEVVDTVPLELPALDWQTLLQQAVYRLCATNAHPEDEIDPSSGQVRPAGYSVITDIAPCWVGMTKDTLVPGYYCVTEERVRSDDSVEAIFALYGDAKTLMGEE